MSRKNVLLVAVLTAVTIGLTAPPAAEAGMCSSRCELIFTCFTCEFTLFFDVFCIRESCNDCRVISCWGGESLKNMHMEELGIQLGSVSTPACPASQLGSEPPELLSPESSRVVSVTWLPPRT